ncbi:MAG: DUF1643 domain-containing protein [Methylococcales bacterium]
MDADAIFSECRNYRYALWRTWDKSKPYAMFIGLNPSTADEIENDNTINRCISFATDWGYGGLCMTNLFAFCTKDPDEMKAAKNPIGPENNEWLNKLSNNAGIIIAAWGDDGSHLGRSKEVIAMFPNLKCLKINKTGEPAHPLYQPGSAVPINMSI